MDVSSLTQNPQQLSNTTQVLHVESLPIELMLQIFSWLSAKELCTCSQVSKNWRFISNDDTLWKKFLGSLSRPKEGNVKKLLLEQAVSSLGGIDYEWRKFVFTKHETFSGQFNISFAHYPTLYIRATRRVGMDGTNHNANQAEKLDNSVTRIVMQRLDDQISPEQGHESGSTVIRGSGMINMKYNVNVENPDIASVILKMDTAIHLAMPLVPLQMAV